MEKKKMGRVLVEATIENLGDLLRVREGLLGDAQVRRLQIEDALVAWTDSRQTVESAVQ